MTNASRKLLPTFAILQMQLRLLRSNPSTSVTLLLLAVVGAWFGRFAPPPAEPTCYVVYWQDDAWVAHLRSRLPQQAGPLKIELAPVQQFTDESGLVLYPRGAHSIQMRPPQAGLDQWTIWYWYSGDRAEVMEPAVRWFWQASREHWGDRLPLEVRSSSLEPTNPLTDVAIQLLPRSNGKAGLAGMLALAAVFFSCAYLQAAHLAEQIHDRVLPTILTKPMTLWHWLGTVSVFHGLIAVLVATPTLWANAWPCGLFRAVEASVLLAIGCSGIAWFASFTSRSVTHSTSLVLLYCLLSGLALASSLVIASLPVGALSAEWSYLTLLVDPNATGRTWVTLLVWSGVCVGVGWWSAFRWTRA